MRRLGKFNNNIVAILLVLVLIILVYSVTSTINTISVKDPQDCNDTFFSIDDICFNPEQIAFNNYQTTVEIKVKNTKTDINGFKINIFGKKGIKPIVLFKTVQSGGETTLSAPYDKSILGEITKLEIKPILNINQEIIYCSLNHGNIYDGEITVCKE